MADKHKNNPFKNKSGENPEVNLEENFQETHELSEQTSGIEESCNSELQVKFDALNQQYIRLAADFDNYRKRQESEREELLKFGTQNALAKLIDVLDNFERGEKALENVEDCEQAKESFKLVHKQTMDVLQKIGMEIIETEGQQFDPNFHDAVMQTPTEEYPDHQIINELQKGYKYGDRVLRPALVNVATN